MTGGAGFIGSNLCGVLLEKGHDVVCFDNVVTGDHRNILEFKENPRFQFIQGDTRTLKTDFSALGGAIDEVYDLASPASVTFIMDHPVEVALVNSVGTYNVIELAKKHHAKFLFASSSEAYGDPKEHPQKESYWGNVNPIGVRSGYDEGKRFGEALTMGYLRQYHMDIKIARIFNTYGIKSSPNDSRVVPTFVAKAIKGQPLPVHGDGSQTRSFCYVTDLVNGLIALMESNQHGPVNLGNPDEFTILDFAKRVLAVTKSKSTIVFVDRPEDDPAVRRPDITLAREKLHWEPKVSLDDGLVLTSEYFRSILA